MEAFALTCGARVQQLCGDETSAREQAEAAMQSADEQGLTGVQALGQIVYGWALATHCAAEEGRSQLHAGLTANRATTGEVHRTYYLSLLAEAYAKAGWVDEGLATIEEALAQVARGGEQYWEAELYRLKGQLTLQSKQATDKSKTIPTPSTPHLTPKQRRKPKRVF